MADLNLPSNVKYDTNTGGYFITNAQGQTLRVQASTQGQLDSYVNSVNTGTPITVTTTSPITGNPNTQTFNPTAIYKDQEDSGNRLAAMTAVKRQTGIIGNNDGSYYDLRTSQTITREQAEAKVAAAGLPPESLNLVTPRSSPAYNEAQASLDNTVNRPSNLGGTAAPLNPVQSPAGPGTGAVVTQSVPPYTATGITQEQEQAQLLAGVTENPAPIATTGDEALAAAQAAQEVADLQIAAESATPVDPYTEGLLLEQEQLRQFQADEELNARLDRAAELDLANSGDAAAEAAARAKEAADLQVAAESANPVSPLDTGYVSDAEQIARMSPAGETTRSGVSTSVGILDAQKQSTLQARINQPSAADWRVRLQLAAGAKYLYQAEDPGILKPLYDTDGVVFPYTPSIETAYKAKYDAYDLVHSNYRGYFYKNSNVEEISIKGTFTAQDTKEAQYLLAVIHFFRSVTKMFYGQDPQAGAPPPLVFLSGFGQYQFNQHACVVSSFNYSLPTDVDYIRADGFNNIGLNLENRRTLGSGPALGGSLGTIQRLLTNLLPAGGEPKPPWPGAVTQNISNRNSINSTYVPTKMEVSISLLPMQTRNQISQQFSLEGFAQGRLLTKGFW